MSFSDSRVVSAGEPTVTVHKGSVSLRSRHESKCAIIGDRKL
jgi:hypothetical protein